jgi:hypothetical protein
MDKLHQLQSALCADPARLRVLRLVRDLCLPDCWVGAGLVRSAIWDMQHRRPFSPLPSDIDVIWFDETLLDPGVDNLIEANLCRLAPSLNWSVKNQARMHVRNDDPPYSCATSAMEAWPETATAVAVRLGKDEVIEVAAPFGLDDLFNLVVRPTARFEVEKKALYLGRIRSKNWAALWPSLYIIDA